MTSITLIKLWHPFRTSKSTLKKEPQVLMGLKHWPSHFDFFVMLAWIVMLAAWGRCHTFNTSSHDEVTPSMEKALDDQQGNINALLLSRCCLLLCYDMGLTIDLSSLCWDHANINDDHDIDSVMVFVENLQSCNMYNLVITIRDWKTAFLKLLKVVDTSVKEGQVSHFLLSSRQSSEAAGPIFQDCSL